MNWKRVGITLVLLLLTGQAPAQSLRERVEAARAKARGSAAASKASPSSAGTRNFDPESSAEAWRITSYGVPGRMTFGSFDAGGHEGRIYADAPRDAVADLTEGTPVFLYEHTREGEFAVWGRAYVRKVRPKRSVMAVEVAPVACRDCHFRPNRVTQVALERAGLIGGSGPSQDPRIIRIRKQAHISEVDVLKLKKGVNLKKRRFYMSVEPLGAASAWTEQQAGYFLEGQAWKGMPADALFAMLGAPDMKNTSVSPERHLWGLGVGVKQFHVRDGVVVDLSLGVYDVN